MSKRNPTKKAQKTPLDSKNEKLINVLEAMEDRVSIISKQHVIQYANAALEKDLGPATGRKCYEYFRDRKTACPECKDRVVWAGKTVHKEWYSPKNKKTYESTDTPLTNPDGTISMLNILHDITERKQTEEKYRTLYETTRDGIAGGPMDGRVLECNQAFADMLGYSKEELKNLTYRQLTPKQWHQGEAKIVKEQILKRGYSDEYEKEYIRKDGTVFPVSARVWLVKDEQGRPVGMWGTVRDITERKQAEEALKERNRLNELLLNSLPHPAMLIRKDRTVLAANRIALEVGAKVGGFCWRDFGQSDFIPESDKEYINKNKKAPPGGTRCYFCLADEALKNQEPANNPELKAWNKVWDAHWVPLSEQLYLHYAIDITDQKKAQEELLFKTTLLEAQSETSIDGILVVDEEGKSILFNKRFGQMWNIPQWILDTKDDKKMLQYVLDQLKNPDKFLEKVKYLYKHKDQTSRDEIEFKDGKVFDRYSSALIDSSGTYHGRIWYFRDITHRKRAEEALRWLLRRNELILQTSADGFCVVDHKGKLLEVNPALCAMTGYPKEELVGMELKEIEATETTEQIAEHIKTIMKQGYKRFERKHRRKDGKIIDVEVSTQFCELGQDKFFFSFWRNITEHKRLANELKRYKEQILKTQRHAYIDSMGAIVAHQLNQPLTVINMLLGEALEDLSKEPSVPETVLRNLRESMSEAEKTASIISEFRRRVKEQSWDEIGQADVAETATKLTSALTDDAVRANLHITVNPLDGLPTVKCAAAALEQIFFIIIQNAIEAADGKKRHKLTISAKARDGKVELQFSDDCCGIAPENLEKIFEPFYTTKSDGGGMGLGLEIVRRILIACGGDIHVESDIGRGTTFYVVLSAADSINS